MFCSDTITNAASCYMDDWSRITNVFGVSLLLGLVFAVTVSIIVYAIKK